MGKKRHITAEEVRALFGYSPEEGHLRWRTGKNAGQIAGAVSKALGYRMVNIRGVHQQVYYAHRLIWLWMYGKLPYQIDHINLDGADNRLVNLRIATRSENLANQHVRAKTGFKGVWQHGPSWATSIRKDNKTHHLGVYPTPELAHAAYCEAAKSMYGEFARSA